MSCAAPCGFWWHVNGQAMKLYMASVAWSVTVEGRATDRARRGGQRPRPPVATLHSSVAGLCASPRAAHGCFCCRASSVRLRTTLMTGANESDRWVAGPRVWVVGEAVSGSLVWGPTSLGTWPSARSVACGFGLVRREHGHGTCCEPLQGILDLPVLWLQAEVACGVWRPLCEQLET